MTVGGGLLGIYVLGCTKVEGNREAASGLLAARGFLWGIGVGVVCLVIYFGWLRVLLRFLL